MLYLLVISAATLLIALLNTVLGDAPSVGVFAALLLRTAAGVLAVFLVDGICAFIIRRLPEKWFAPDAPAFAVGRRECAFYRRSGIQTWKRHVPEWGCFTGFHKDRMQDAHDAAYLGRFLLESNYGVLGHLAGALLGFLILLLPFLSPWGMALPIAAVNALLSLLPTALLRYNTAPLRRLYARAREREQRAAARSNE